MPLPFWVLGFEFGDPFFCLMWSDVESLYWIFQFNYCIFQLCDLFGTFKYILFVEISPGLCTVLLASVALVLKLLFSKSLISISLRSVSVLLFGTYPFLHFPWWSIFCALEKTATSPSLDRVISHRKCPLSSSPTLALGGLSLVCVSSCC